MRIVLSSIVFMERKREIPIKSPDMKSISLSNNKKTDSISAISFSLNKIMKYT